MYPSLPDPYAPAAAAAPHTQIINKRFVYICVYEHEIIASSSIVI